jgi:aspartyl-tRNA(Asn)/glutamyl-tRNA(Gln) amidotransferase subunit A
MDHPGPMARCVRDLGLLFQFIAGAEPRWPNPEHALADFEAVLNEPQAPPRLGRIRGLFQDRAEPAMRTMVDDVARKLAGQGACVSESALPASFAEVVPRHRTVMAVEGAAFHEARLRKHSEDYGPKIRGLLEEGLSCPAPEYARCKEHQAKLKQEMSACFSDVDALLTPATLGPAPAASTTGDPAFNSPWSYTGLPTVSFPVGLSPDGLPLAIQLVGERFQEARLLAVAAWCEQALGIQPLTLPGGGS